MPTILTHPAVPVALTAALAGKAVSRPLLLAGVAFSILPDLDVLAFRLGVPYGAGFGHRGFSHSLLFAAAVALLGAGLWRVYRTTFLKAFFFLFVCAASHGVLDAFTDGGMGVAFLWPWTDDRYFAPVQVIAVSPLGLSRFLSWRGATVLLSEVAWVWLPLIGVAAVWRSSVNWSQAKQKNVELRGASR